MKKFIITLIILLLAAGAAWYFWPEPGSEPALRLEQATTIPAKDHSPLTLADAPVTFADGTEATFQLAEGFALDVVAEDLGKARFLTKSPDGRLFVPDMVNFNDNTQGAIYILEDFDETAGEFATRHTYLSGLRNPHSLAFYRDVAGQTWLYIALTEKLVRYPYEAGDTEPSGEAETIMEFSAYRTIDGDVWHITRTLHFDNHRLYVSVGSSCNVCEEPEDEVRAEVITIDPDGGNLQPFATGLRNAVGLAQKGSDIYATNNGPDHLGPNAPDDGMYRLEAGKDYGFPYCYEVDGEMREDDTRNWEREPIDCDSIPKLFSVFGARTAPLGLTYIASGHPRLTDTFLAALHGSYQRLPRGYNLTRVLPDGTAEVFMDGFFEEGSEPVGRPVHVLSWDENTLFVSDDFNGRIYRTRADS